MEHTELARFRRMCGQFRWLAVFMVVTIGASLVLTFVAVPLFASIRDGEDLFGPRHYTVWIWFAPTAFYLAGVWMIGSALGQLAKGRLIQPTLSSALRRVGLALGLGGVMSVFVVSNVLRLLEQSRGGFLHFDVAGMTLGMVGGALYLLGRVVDQAGALQSELDEII